jgi:hypothetical protein
LQWFDALFYGLQGPGRRADVQLVRYADDFVALAKQMGSETIEFIESRLEGKVPVGDQSGKDASGGPAGRRGKSELFGMHVSVRSRSKRTRPEISERIPVE